MKEWDEIKDKVKESIQDKEMAKSILKMIDIRIDAINLLKKEKHTSIIVEGYYEIIKEAITALMAIDGFKTTSHEALVSYLKKFYNEFGEYEIIFIDDLRKIRHKIAYKGFFIKQDYLNRNSLEIKNIISKLKEIIKKKLND